MSVFAPAGFKYTLHTILKPVSVVLSDDSRKSIGAKAGLTSDVFGWSCMVMAILLIYTF